MEKTVEQPGRRGSVWSTPRFPGPYGFGRRNMNVSPAEAKAYTLYQLGALDAFCKAKGMEMQHVKLTEPCTIWQPRIIAFKAICEAIFEYNKNLIVLALSGGELAKAAKDGTAHRSGSLR